MGGDTGQQSPAMQQLLAEQQRRELAKAFQSSMQGLGAAVGRQTPLPSLGGGGQGAPAAVYGAMPGPSTPGPTGVATGIGPLFRPPGGIDEQQLAMILKQLGYG